MRVIDNYQWVRFYGKKFSSFVKKGTNKQENISVRNFSMGGTKEENRTE